MSSPAILDEDTDMATQPAFTPGPWAWFGNRSGGVYLATPDRGRRYIMGFRRYGMNGAQPTFAIGGIMQPASELVAFAVGDGTARGFKEADKDPSVYRYDVREIDHPDARLIAAAPDLLEALSWFINDIDSTHTKMVDFDANVERARAAIAKATAA